MGKINRGRLTLSTNVILTTSLITRTLTFGYIMLSIYIKVGNDILDTNVIKMMNIPKVFGMPLGSTVQAIVFSLIVVFVLEFVNGILGLIGSVGKKKTFLILAVLMSSLMIMVYTVYIVLISLIYHKTGHIYDTLLQYANAYTWGGTSRMSYEYYLNVYPGFLSELGCGNSHSESSTCIGAYKEQVRTYLQTYFGMIVTCLVCHIFSIVAVEYTYRKIEFKENHSSLSSNKYYLLLSIRHGIGRTFVCCIRDTWRKSKVIFFSVTVRLSSLIVSLGLLGLGLTLCGDEFIADSSLRHIFYKLRFYRYTFYDILIGLAASAVVIGILGTVSSTVSLLGTLIKSNGLLILGCLSSTFLIIPKILVFIIWAAFIEEINDEMKYQLKIQQDGYYEDHYYYRITTSWNYMIMMLDCCGVYSPTDTFSHSYGTWFCCKNSHESRMRPGSSYNNGNNYYLEYFGGCGGYRNDTCNGKIIFKTRMYIGWFLAIVLLLILLETVCILLTNKEYFISQHQHGDNNDVKTRKCSKICLPTITIFRETASGIKSFFIRHCKRSHFKVVYFVSVGLIMILSFCTLGIAVHTRYDTVFGNKEIKKLLGRISITDTNLNKAIENFSIVVSTFSVAPVVTVVYSVSILVPTKTHKVFLIVGLGLWSALVMSHVIEISLWTKFLTEVNASVTYQLAVDIYSYSMSHKSLSSYDELSYYWNTLFVKGQCCGVSNAVITSRFVGTSWYSSSNRDASQVIPVQCCPSQADVHPYDKIYDSSCTNALQSYHTQGCDTVIEERLKNNFSIPFLVLTSIIVVAEILCIVTIIISLMRKDHKDMSDKLVDKTTSLEYDTKETNHDKRNMESTKSLEVAVKETSQRKTNSDEKDKMKTSKTLKDKKKKKHKHKSASEDNKVNVNEGTVIESYGLSENRRSSVMTHNDAGETSKDMTKNEETIRTNIENDIDNNTEINSVSKSNLSEGQNAAEEHSITTDNMKNISDIVKRESSVIDDSKNRHDTGQKHTSEAITNNETFEDVANTSMNATENHKEARDKELVPDLDVEEFGEL